MFIFKKAKYGRTENKVARYHASHAALIFKLFRGFREIIMKISILISVLIISV